MVRSLLTKSGRGALGKIQGEIQRLIAESKEVPPGEYLACLNRLTVASGSPCSFLLRFMIISPEEHLGRAVFRRLWATEGGLQATRADLRKIGIKAVDEIESEEMDLNIVCKIFVGVSDSDSSVSFFAPCDV